MKYYGMTYYGMKHYGMKYYRMKYYRMKYYGMKYYVSSEASLINSITVAYYNVIFKACAKEKRAMI